MHRLETVRFPSFLSERPSRLLASRRNYAIMADGGFRSEVHRQSARQRSSSATLRNALEAAVQDVTYRRAMRHFFSGEGDISPFEEGGHSWFFSPSLAKGWECVWIPNKEIDAVARGSPSRWQTNLDHDLVFGRLPESSFLFQTLSNPPYQEEDGGRLSK